MFYLGRKIEVSSTIHRRFQTTMFKKHDLCNAGVAFKPFYLRDYREISVSRNTTCAVKYV